MHIRCQPLLFNQQVAVGIQHLEGTHQMVMHLGKVGPASRGMAPPVRMRSEFATSTCGLMTRHIRMERTILPEKCALPGRLLFLSPHLSPEPRTSSAGMLPFR